MVTEKRWRSFASAAHFDHFGRGPSIVSGQHYQSVTAWLLDSKVVSEIRKRRADRKVVAFAAEQPLELL